MRAQAQRVDVLRRRNEEACLHARAHLVGVELGRLLHPRPVHGGGLALHHHFGRAIERGEVGQGDRRDLRAELAERVGGGLHRGADLRDRAAPGRRSAGRGRSSGLTRRLRAAPRSRAPASRWSSNRWDRGRRSTPSIRALSRTVRVSGPTWSRRPRARDGAGAAHAAVGRLHADHAAGRGGQADRAAGVGAQRAIDHARGDRGARAARAAAGDAGLVPRIAAMAVMHVVAGRAGGELRHVEEAQLDHARGVELLQHRRRHRRHASRLRMALPPVESSPLR